MRVRYSSGANLKLNLALLAVAASLTIGGIPSAHADNDVAVKKNADGTVEVSDAPGHGGRTSQSAAPSEGPRVIYHLKNDVGTRHINGVSVRTNPDGSIETSDGESAPVPMHSHSSASHHATHAKTPPKKHK